MTFAGAIAGASGWYFPRAGARLHWMMVRARTTVSRCRVVLGAMAAGSAGAVLAVRGRLRAMTQFASFAAPPPLVPHDPVCDRATIYVAHGASPAANVDTVLDKIGGISMVVGVDDLVIPP